MPTVQEIINRILEDIPGERLDDTVDTLKVGDPDQEVTGIVTTFLASHDVIEKAAALGANFIITHEPTFYNHRDEVEGFRDDPVYRAKRELLESSGIAVWRFHDYWHRHEPDGIMTGVLKELGWEAYLIDEERPVLEIPPVTLAGLVSELKEKLDIAQVRVVGDPQMRCDCVALSPGAAPARWHFQLLAQPDVDVLVAGEVREWETSEYTRDAISQGHNKALVVLGHALSEEPGMAWLVSWLRERFPDVPVNHVPVGDAFRYL